MFLGLFVDTSLLCVHFLVTLSRSKRDRGRLVKTAGYFDARSVEWWRIIFR